VTQEDIERLVSERSLAREHIDDDQVAGFWIKALGSYTDANTPGISSEGAFQLTYSAALQAAFAVLAAHDLRVRSATNHYNAFYAMQKLMPSLALHARLFDELRRTRRR
jgi:hypothetical protein